MIEAGFTGWSGSHWHRAHETGPQLGPVPTCGAVRRAVFPGGTQVAIPPT